MQQLHPERLLQQGDALADVGLRIAELMRRGNETQAAGDFAKEPEITEHRFIKHDLVIMECKIG
ncbi:hypothetical protein GCM10011400_60440 [Paraburkholderia caffeinilytica]|uniref:Uncharacterized protein n=1 Tax=Paraburkholderia caffeinilytica TaxID=1761016 RepID=A0ABQ1NEJ7_9BURK|nr:hypothetical protein GCM10011400_60440 [Paraburkholderia caffeinilytica]